MASYMYANVAKRGRKRRRRRRQTDEHTSKAPMGPFSLTLLILCPSLPSLLVPKRGFAFLSPPLKSPFSVALSLFLEKGAQRLLILIQLWWFKNAWGSSQSFAKTLQTVSTPLVTTYCAKIHEFKGVNAPRNISNICSNGELIPC